MSFLVRDARPGDGQPREEIRIADWRAAYASILDPDWLAALAGTDERVATCEQRIATQRPGAVTLVSEEAGVVIGLAALVPTRDDVATAELAALYIVRCGTGGLA